MFSKLNLELTIMKNSWYNTNTFIDDKFTVLNIIMVNGIYIPVNFFYYKQFI